jgi:UDP-N-acetylglucosamine 2-epimerase (non-hydrolysing)/GDP/UDP-N,N'-diacetylbacillosamine 2-epimerase (hydrolysing)
MMAHAAAMVGNSSSGIIEAPSFRLPVVNIGTRQGGRVRAINVVDVDYRRTSIHEGICQVLDDRWRRRLRRMGNPYFRAGASVLIARILATCALDAGLIAKCFWALPGLRGNSPQRRELLQKVTKQTKGAAGGRRREAR